ncbi:MAG: peptidoglycan DD-metalloendopeptidase family protein [Candidatus Aminicenantes bacterium]
MKANIHTRNRKKPRRISLLLFMLASFSLFMVLNFLPKERQKTATYEELQKQDTPLESDPIQKHEVTIQKGKTLSDILLTFDFSPADIHQLRQDVKPVYDLAKIRAGNKMRIFTEKKRRVQSIEYDIDNEEYLHIVNDQGSFTAEIREIEYEVKLKLIWGEIVNNPISAVNKQGERASLAISLAEIFAWDIDFYLDLRQGDTFKILFEKKYLDGKFVGYRNILAAEFTNREKTFQAFRYTYPDTKESDYFDFQGNSLRKEFLKSPVNFTRITSRFSYSRLHPVRKVYRPHMGVDYAAPVGTPVRATADGTVTFTGWSGASGRLVRIRHKKGYETMYLHLRGFAKGIRKGKTVKGGDTIGYVGASGEVNGPHLDYRIKHRGQHINPLAARFDPVEPLRMEFKTDFQKAARQYLLLLDAPLILLSTFSNPLQPITQ